MRTAYTALRHPVATGRRWVRRIGAVEDVLRTGAFDVEWYQAQTGRTFRTLRGAVIAYLRTPRNRGFSPHPLFEVEYLDAGGRGEGLVRYLTTPRASRFSPHPLFDVAVARRQLRAAHPDEPVTHPWAQWVATATADTAVPVPEGMSPITWGELRSLLLAAVREWRDSEPEATSADWTAAAAQPRQPGRTSIVVPVATDLRGPTTARQLLNAKASDADWEVVLVAGDSRAEFCCLQATARTLPVVAVRSASTSAPELVNAGALAAGGDKLVLSYPGARFDAATVGELGEVLDGERIGIAQPLNQNPNTTLRSAGAWFPSGAVAPSPLLGDHPVEDGIKLGRTRLPAAYSVVVGVTAADFLRLRGLDPTYPDALAAVDLSLRSDAAGLGETWLVPGARVTVAASAEPVAAVTAASLAALQEKHATPPSGYDDLLTRAGFRALAGARPVTEDGLPQAPRLERLPLQVVEGRPRLRWAIDIAAPAGPAGDAWGDRYFARSLAAAFARLGQDAIVDHREARRRPSREFDDVVLALRGVDEVMPEPGPTNVLWVISHPDLATAHEVLAYDLVFAAGQPWAETRSKQWGVEIRTLLQCTDPAIFNPDRAAPDTGSQVLFVGNSRGVPRPAVVGAIECGAEVDVYGRGWESVIPEQRVVARVVPNEKVGELYAAAGIVLNDHWEDMRRHGFLSNRLFDAVASGTRVVSDTVPGLAEVFGEAVQIFETGADMCRLVSDPYDTHFLDWSARKQIAARIAAEHSFDVRARELLDGVLSFRSSRA